MEQIHHVRKAIVAAAGAAIIVAGDEGVAAAEDIPTFVAALATVVGVYLAKND